MGRPERLVYIDARNISLMFSKNISNVSASQRSGQPEMPIFQQCIITQRAPSRDEAQFATGTRDSAGQALQARCVRRSERTSS